MKKLLILSLFVIVVIEGCSGKIHEADEITGDNIPIMAQIGFPTKAIVGNSNAFEIDFVRMNTSSTTNNYTFTTTGSGYRAGSTENGNITFSNQFYNKNNDYSYFRCFNKLSSTKDQTAKTFTWVVDGKSDLLVSDVWNAGKYTAPSQTSIEFNHLLSRIEVICQANSSGIISVVKLLWGNITSITVSTNQKVIYDYSNNNFSYSTPINLPLNEGLTDNAISSSGIAILDFGSKNATANAIIPPTANEKLTLKIKTLLIVEQTIEVTIPGGLAAGKTHTITINFPNSLPTKSISDNNDITYTHSSREW